MTALPATENLYHPAEIRYAHLVDETERARTAARRRASETDRILPELRHAIEHGNTDAALDMLITVDRHTQAILDALIAPRFTD